jgi:hypothetical protein
MVKIPSWIWVVVPASLLVFGLINQLTESAYWRGIAEDTAIRVEEQQVVIDSISERTDSLEIELERSDSAIVEIRTQNQIEVARLRERSRQAQMRSEAITASLRESLDSIQVVKLDEIVESYETQIAVLDSLVIEEQTLTAAERLRADQAQELILTMRQELTAHEFKDIIQRRQLEALDKAMNPSLGLRLKVDWWFAATGLAAGYVIWGR